VTPSKCETSLSLLCKSQSTNSVHSRFHNGRSCQLVWDPSKAQEKGIILEEGRDVISGVAHNIRESALLELARLDYDVDLFRTSVINSLKPTDGSDWSREQKDKFHAEIFRLRRDIRAVAKSTELPIKTCHAYFLGTYKSTCEYRLLKAVCLEEREGKAATVEHGPDACAVCGDGGSLLICDGCEGEFHMSCLRPPLKVVPEGQWLCDECVDRRVLEARYFLIRHSKLFEKVDVNQMNEKKRSFDQFQGVSKSAGDSNFVETEESGASGKVIYRPVAPFLEAVREYSSKISKVLSKTGDD
jgi:PHD-finger